MSKGKIAIGGAGCAGAAVATLLARSGYEVLVFELNLGPAQRIGEVLPPSANALLEKIGLGRAAMSEVHLRAHGTRSIWGSTVPVENHFLAGRGGTGWHLDRAAFEGQLVRLAEEAGARFYFGRAFDSAGADFLVDATGRRAAPARRAGAKRMVHGHLAATTRTFEPSAGAMEDSFTLVESCRAGWWYSSLLPSGRLVVSFLSDADLPEIRLAQQESAFLQLLAETGETIRRIETYGYRPTGRARMCTASSACLDRMGGERWLAIGDAALSYDPLSSHGIVSALGTALLAAETIPAALAGDEHAAERYSSILLDSFRQYLKMLSDHYAQECRWPDEPFWRRRSSDRCL